MDLDPIQGLHVSVQKASDRWANPSPKTSQPVILDPQSLFPVCNHLSLLRRLAPKVTKKSLRSLRVEGGGRHT